MRFDIPPHLVAQLDQAIAKKGETLDRLVEKYRQDSAVEGGDTTFASMVTAFAVGLPHSLAIELLAVAIKRLAEQPQTQPTPVTNDSVTT